MNQKQGILTGCDSNYDWMLKWWWSHYEATNHYPVTFIDFGMTPSAKAWCEQKGTVLSLPQITPDSPPPTASPYACSKRAIWLSKPQALLNTPYQKTIWIDIDAQVKQSLSTLFALCPEDTLALCPEIAIRAAAEKAAGLIPKQAISFNTGVIAYPQKAPLLTLWAEAATKHHALGDQDLLSRLIFENNLPIKQLPTTYNRIHPDPDDPKVVIYHYASKLGQSLLLEKINLRETS